MNNYFFFLGKANPLAQANPLAKTIHYHLCSVSHCFAFKKRLHGQTESNKEASINYSLESFAAFNAYLSACDYETEHLLLPQLSGRASDAVAHKAPQAEKMCYERQGLRLIHPRFCKPISFFPLLTHSFFNKPAHSHKV